MRLLRCFVSVLLVFVLLFALCSTSCYALAVPDNWSLDNSKAIPIENNSLNSISNFAISNDTEYKIRYVSYARDSNTHSFIPGTVTANRTSNIPIDEGSFGSWNIRNYCWSDYKLSEVYTFYRSDGAIIGTEGMSLKLHIKDIMLTACNSGDGYLSPEIPFNPAAIELFFIILTDAKGNQHYQELNPSDYFFSATDSGFYNIILDIDSLPCDVKTVDIEFIYQAYHGFPGIDPNNFPNIYKNSGIGNYGDKETTIDMFCRTDTGNLLSNIIKVVTNGFDNLKSGISNVVSGITELPGKLWSFIENGLKGLFIPTEEQLTDVKTDWDNLLSDRFGGLYQSVQLIDDYAKTFTNTDSKNTIKVPELSVDLADSTFTFGGQDVQIIPDKFSFLIDVIKTIISIIATTFFVNGLRNRFTREVIDGGNEQ